jgi:HEAT repeat protein
MKSKNSLLVISVILALTFVGCTRKADQPQVSAVQKQNIAQLIGQLDGENLELVVEAIDQIAAIGPSAEAAIPALLRKLQDRDFSVSYRAQEALVAIGENAAKAIIQSNDKAVISEYCLILDKFEPSAVVRLVIEEIPKTKNPEKFMFLLMAISDMGEPAKAALPLIKGMRAKNTNPAMEALLSLIQTQIEEGREGVDKLQERSKAGMESSQKRIDEINREFRETVDQAISFNISLNPPEARVLMRKWGNSLGEGMPALEIMLASEDVNDRLLACAILMKFCEQDKNNIPNALPKIKHLCLDEESIVSLLASVIANKFGDKTDYSEQYINVLKAFDDGMSMVFALGGLNGMKAIITDEECITILKTLLEAKTKELSLGAALLLINSGFTQEVQKYAEGLMSDPISSEMRFNGVALIVKIGPAAQSSIPKMRWAYDMEDNEDKRAFIRMAISSLGEAKDDLDGLIEQTNNPERIMRLDAFSKMEKMSSQKKKESIPFLLNSIRDGNEDLQMLALSTLCSYGVDAEPALNSLIKLLEYAIANEKATMQFYIVGVLGEIGGEEAIKALFEAFRDCEEEAARSAMLALINFGPKAKAIVPGLLELAKDPKHREDSLRVLDSINILETAEQCKAVAGFLSESRGSSGFMAMRVLVAQGKEVCVPLFQDAVLSTNSTASMNGFSGIFMVGEEDSDFAIQALEQLKLKTSDPKVKKRIDRTIEEIKEKGSKGTNKE